MKALEKPNLSPNFTMEDLYRLREYNSLRHCEMSTEEIRADIGDGAKAMLEKIEQMRKEKAFAGVIQ